MNKLTVLKKMYDDSEMEYHCGPVSDYDTAELWNLLIETHGDEFHELFTETRDELLEAV